MNQRLKTSNPLDLSQLCSTPTTTTTRPGAADRSTTVSDAVRPRPTVSSTVRVDSRHSASPSVVLTATSDALSQQVFTDYYSAELLFLKR